MNRKYILPLVVLTAAVGAAVFFVCRDSSHSSTEPVVGDVPTMLGREPGMPAMPAAPAGTQAALAPAPDAGVRTAPAGYKGEGWHVSDAPSEEAAAAAVHTGATLVLDPQQQQAAGAIPAAVVGAVVPSSSPDTTLSAKGSDAAR